MRGNVRQDQRTATSHRFDHHVWTTFEPAERDKRVSAFHECPDVRDVAGEDDAVSDAGFTGQSLELLPQWTITADERDKRHVIRNLRQSENQVLYVLACI